MKHKIFAMLVIVSSYSMVTAGIWLSGADISLCLMLQGALTILFSLPAFTMDD